MIEKVRYQYRPIVDILYFKDTKFLQNTLFGFIGMANYETT